MSVVAYKIRETNVTDGGSSVVTIGNVTTYQFTNRVPGKTYRVEVKSVDNNGNESAYSAPVDIMLVVPADNVPPSNVTTFTATTASASQINLAWSPASDNSGIIGGYIIERATNSLFTENYSAVTQNGTGSNRPVADLLADTTYYFRIKAKDGAGNLSAAWSEVKSAKTDPEAPGVTYLVMNGDKAVLDGSGNAVTTNF